MPFPTHWPPRPASGLRSIRFYVTGSATASFGDNAWLFVDQVTANTIDPTPYLAPGDTTTKVQVGDLDRGGSPMGGREIAQDAAPPQHESPPATQQASPKAQLWANTIRIVNEGLGDLQVSFDGTNVHGYIPASSEVIYRERFESGICLRGVGATPTFHVEAW